MTPSQVVGRQRNNAEGKGGPLAIASWTGARESEQKFANEA